MKRPSNVLFAVLASLLAMAGVTRAHAQYNPMPPSPSQYCDGYARSQADYISHGTSRGGALGGATRGAAGGAIFGAIGGNAGAGAAVGAGLGAIVGSARKNDQFNSIYRQEYDNCMRRQPQPR